ncbi:MAG: SMC-Scp complex subunit ScpB [Candidatus Schekmanbacteria bacterium]|nr:MAG: SMC-Scp complex subunit ScpB [Candidatus Schekmanbacteria bacterium]
MQQKYLSFTVESLKPIIEALIFVSEEPLTINKMVEIVKAEKALIKEAVYELIEDYDKNGRGMEIIEVAGGFKMKTRTEFSKWISELYTTRKKVRLSIPALETLAVIAYKQPITKAEIEQIRGVNIGGTLKTLLERDLIKILGKKEAPGRPIMYGTTKTFLELFGLKDLSSLPTLKEFSELGFDLSDSQSEETNKGEEENEGETTENNSGSGDSVAQESGIPDNGGESKG